MNAVDRLAGIERLSSLDSGFLALETPTTPMHMGSVTYLEPDRLRDRHGRIRLGELRRLVDDRLSVAPHFRQRPVAAPLGLGRPVWVDDPDFDVANHVNELVLPPPGSEHQLLELCAHLMMRTLERSRPLWELWVVDGYADGYVVLVEKVHHVMMDGVSGVDVVMLLTDPTPRIERLAERERVARNPAAPVLAAAGLLDELGVPLAILGAPVRAAGLLADTLRHPSRAVEIGREIETLGRGVMSLARSTTVAPRTQLNEPVGSHRVYEHAEVPLTEMRRIAKAFDCTVNDVALAAVTSGVRRLLLDREEEPGTRFQVAVPVSTRPAGEHLTLGNKVALFLVPLPVGMSNELAQLEAVRQLTRELKGIGQASAIAAVVGAANRWPTPVVDLIAHLTHHQPFANAVVTNVPGPPARRYLLGARIKRLAPIVPLAGNLDVSIALFSYDEEISFGCFADAERCPDLHVLVDGIRAGLEALGVLASQRQGVVS